jgi:hypothetical protein
VLGEEECLHAAALGLAHVGKRSLLFALLTIREAVTAEGHGVVLAFE